MIAANRHRGEIAFRLEEDREVVLRLTWDAAAKIANAWRGEIEAIRKETGQDVADWGWVLKRAFDDSDLLKVAFFLSCAASDHHPEVTPDVIMAASPARHLSMIACNELAALHYWGPAGPPADILKAEQRSPFVLATLSHMLSRLRPRTA